MKFAPLQTFSAIIFFLSTSVFGCGRVINPVTPLSASDSGELSDKYPWHAALYKSDRDAEHDDPRFICGGTLIDHNKVITAAYCVTGEDAKPIKENLTVILGKVHSDWNTVDQYQQKHQISKIIVHKDYRGHRDHFENAMAIIILKENVTINNHVAPVCLDLESSTDNVPNKQILHMAGWGFDDKNGLRKNLREVPLTYLDRISCKDIIDKSSLQYVTFDRFCVLPTGDESPERGDSAQGTTVERNGQHYLLGIITVGLKEGNIYMSTAVSSHKSWLKSSIHQQ